MNTNLDSEPDEEPPEDEDPDDVDSEPLSELEDEDASGSIFPLLSFAIITVISC